ncbi:MAG: 5-formyltetrahydrofolate cyclo-ligase [Actinomycetota bacterium]|nr:5-formyltetrahydrofolate cyclo-ligase [Actinomycetota bacterium]
MSEAKALLRERLLSSRRAMSTPSRETAGRAITRAVLDLPEIAACRTVAAYLSIGTEPPTMHLVRDFCARGARVVVPVLQEDLDLEWADYVPGSALAQGRRGLREPDGPRLGHGFLAQVDAVIAPALAVDETGTRLGRGGGSYDRALARVAPGCLVVVPLYDGEVLPDVPAEPHDRRVSVAVTPSRVWRF